MGRNFRDMLEARWAEDKFVCVGLDSEFWNIPKSAYQSSYENTLVLFNSAIVETTKDLVCAYKPNIAFYREKDYCPEGIRALQRTIWYIHSVAPDVPVIFDFKCADIGNTNRGSVKLAFDYLDADAVTVNPYLGEEALRPFLERTEKGIFVLCRTSNSGAGELQDLPVNGEPLYRYVARRVKDHWNKNGNCGLVVGATSPHELEKVRSIVGEMPILIPGIGAQGGDVAETVRAGKSPSGRGMIINSSRGVIFASSGADFAEAARREVEKLNEAIRSFL